MVCHHSYLKNKYGDAKTNAYLYSFSRCVGVCVCVCIIHVYTNTIYKLCIYTYIYISHEHIYMLGKETGQLKVMGEKQTYFVLHNLLCLLNFMLMFVNT